MGQVEHSTGFSSPTRYTFNMTLKCVRALLAAYRQRKQPSADAAGGEEG